MGKMTRNSQMKKNWLFPALAIGAAVMLSACGDDPSSPTPAPVPPASSAVVPVPTSSAGGSGTVQTPYGTLPTTADPNAAYTWYGVWKGIYYKTLPEEAALYPTLANDWNVVFGNYIAAGMYPARIVWDTQNDSYCLIDECTNGYKKRGCTVSEGIGYGMLLAFFMGDMDALNSLWYYSKGYREYQAGPNLTPWKVGTYSYESLVMPANASSATDADLDIATALILAYYKTGNEVYLSDALLIAGSIWQYEISPTGLIYSGNMATWKKDGSAYNPSYFSPIALRLFALVDKSHDWTGVLNTMYNYMLGVQAKGPGLLPDWSDANGNAVDPKNGSAPFTYYRFFHEAVRVPWRIAWDYYWTQDPRALQLLKGMNDFIVGKTNGNPDNLPTTAGAMIYSAVTGMPDSTLKSANLQPHFHGAWCLTGMGVNQAWVSACTQAFNQKTISGFSYFPHILMTMFGELLNGYFIKPELLPL